MPEYLGGMAVGVWTWGEVLPKRRNDTLYAPVSPCGNKGVHGVHWYSWGGEINVCHGVKHPERTRYVICQVMHPEVREHFPCKHKESGGMQCENLQPHTDEHWFSEHTVRHERAGNGYSCDQLESFD